MDVELTPPEDAPFSREKTVPFLIRTFLKIGSFHRLTQFEDGTLPTTDEQQLFAWKDATLREILSILRNTAPHVAEYRHPLARFSFRTVYVEQGSRGRFASKDLGMVYSRDILGEPGTLTSTAPRLLEDSFEVPHEPVERERDERTLEDLRFVPGDFLLIAVLLPKSVTLPTEINIKGAAPATNGWRTGPGMGSAKGDGGWGAGALASGGPPGAGRGGGHWRGDSSAAPRGARGGGRGGGDVGRDRDRERDRDRDLDRSDRRVPPPRRVRDSPPHRGGGWGDRGRGRRGGRDSRSRSRSPPPRRRRD
ncbi:histone deacetylase complex protein [Mycena belliarum]|uniref:Histone deacetylase complex protein n=1 Tax=Mycena belliarum TaxID=1033014 RepID=A0AAD6UH45_9AGAR|nr:histone deacetylase complex protein [Mycena belliae]